MSEKDSQGTMTNINVRVPVELVEKLRDRFPKYGDKSTFVREAIEQKLREIDQDVALCKTCTLSDRCDVKMTTGRSSCLFYYPPMKRQMCIDCEHWSENQGTCDLVESWNLDMPVVTPNYCWLSPFVPRIYRVSDKRSVDVKKEALKRIILKKIIIHSTEEKKEDEKKEIGKVVVSGEIVDLDGVTFGELQKASSGAKIDEK